ncbi:hypothetical protein [Chelativorans oligotrophicus]|uniref:hypothetical protein n=1 Tax=Chelativorans oligotrophicus TaxID=449974 RepID=UPI00140AB18F|nr:hypothetical protein [Chelativorans oligotrophicus]
MTIASHEGKHQVCCDSCPAGYPNTYAAEDWDAMISDAKTAGWLIRKAKPPAAEHDTSDLFGSAPRLASKASAEPQPYTHTCPDCAARMRIEGRLF